MSQPSVARHMALIGLAVLCIFGYAGWRLRHGVRPEAEEPRPSVQPRPAAKPTELVTTALPEKRAPSPSSAGAPSPSEVLPLPPSQPLFDPLPSAPAVGGKTPAQSVAPRPLPPQVEKNYDAPKAKNLDAELSRNFVWYTVNRGDTLTSIAERYLGSAAKVEEICAANRDIIQDRHRLKAGMRLRLPAEAGNPAPMIGVGRQVVEHVVEKAETLVSIAAKYYGSTSEYYRELLRQANPHLPADSQELKPGTTIVIPAGEMAASGAARKHVVQQGETLSSIARRVYGSAAAWRKIHEANRETVPDPDRLPPGVTLILPP